MFPSRESIDKKQADIDKSVLHDIIDEMENDSNDESVTVDEPNHFQSLLENEKIPELVRHVIPVLIVGTVLLLLSSNLSTGASVDLHASFMESHVHAPALFSFSLGNTIREMYYAGIYPLLFLVVAFSGIWPYAKLAMMMFLWVNSPKSPRHREQRLLLLDSLSKFSLVDTYVLVVMIVAFRYHLQFATTPASVDVYVLPMFGFYGFLLATCLSLVIGHAMVYCHRQSQVSDISKCSTSEAEVSIFDHAFQVEVGKPKMKLTKGVQIGILATYSVTFLLLVIGFAKHSFAFEIGGIAGLALGEVRMKTYSLLSLGASLLQSVPSGYGFGAFVLQVAFYFYAVLTPLGCLTLLATLFRRRLDLDVQRKVLVATEIANAWSAVEVFLLSIVAALFQISTFASFIIGDRCDLINQFLQENFGKYLRDDAVCYSVAAYVNGSVWYLVLGVLLNSLCVSFGLRLVHCAINERIAQAQQEQQDHNNEFGPRNSAEPEGSPTIVTKILASPIGKYLFCEEEECSLETRSRNETNQGEEDPDAEDEASEEELPQWRYWF